MGRWSQARRTGGGPSVLNEMIEALIDDATSMLITWRLPVTPATITEAAIFGLPSGENGVSAVQITPTTLSILFGGTIVDDTQVIYQGNDPGFRSPQTISIG